MNKEIRDVYNFLQEIAWHFGNHGISGRCCGNLSLVEFMALKRVYENPDISIQEIGNALNFTKSGATRIINRLEEKGYAKRQNSDIDGRVCCVSITPKGTAMIKSVMLNYTNYLEELLKGLEQKEVENIKDTLEILVKAIQLNKPFESEIILEEGNAYG